MLSQIQPRNYLTLVALIASALLAACSDGTPSDSNGGTGNSVRAGESVEFEHVSYAEFEQRRLAFDANAMVVDLWATWCIPCLERFPKMVEMHHKYKEQGVQFISLSLDDREDLASVAFAKEFLIKKNAVFPNFLLDENIIDGFDLIGVQTVPAVNVYDARGRLYRQLNNNDPSDQFSDSDIEEAITTVLSSPKQ